MDFIRRHARTLLGISFLANVILLAIIIEPFIVNRPQAPSSMAGMDPSMMQKFTDVPVGAPVPTVDFTLTKDSVGGYDLHVVTTNFLFTPQLINTAAIPDQGHAHLYIDGALTILLAPWYHLAVLTPGVHTVLVSLNANDHSVFALHGQPIQASKQFTASAVQ